MHDVSTFLVRRDRCVAREIRDLSQRDDNAAPAHPEDAGRLVRPRFALDAALADWLDECPLRTVTTTAGEKTQTTRSEPRGVMAGNTESRR